MRRFDRAVMGGPEGRRYELFDAPPWRVDRWAWLAWQVLFRPPRKAARIPVPAGGAAWRRVLGLAL